MATLHAKPASIGRPGNHIPEKDPTMSFLARVRSRLRVHMAEGRRNSAHPLLKLIVLELLLLALLSPLLVELTLL